VAIVLLMLLGLGITATGYVTYNDLGPGWVGELHDLLANAMVLVIIGHLVGVVTASLQHKENLVRSMVTGFKTGAPDQGIGRTWTVVAVAIVIAVLGFWWQQWQSAPKADATATLQTTLVAAK
jgi:hypothetical protein